MGKNILGNKLRNNIIKSSLPYKVNHNGIKKPQEKQQW